MKLLNSIMLIVVMFSAPAFANEDFDNFQHNLKITHGSWNFENRINTDGDDHLQFGKTIEGFNIQLRHTDADNSETRLRVTKKVFEADRFYIKQRVEYRYFQNSDNYFRVRPIIGLDLRHSPGLGFWTEYQASFNFDKEGADNDAKLDAGQLKVGYDKQLTPFSKITPFVQYDHDEDWDKENIFLGINLSFEF